MIYNTKTKEYIFDALIKLMKKKPYENITISEICNVAGVGRMSFYRSYSDKDAILKEYINNEFEKWHKEVEVKETFDLNREIFNFFYTHKDLISLLYKANLQRILETNILITCGYNDADTNVVAYSKSMFAYAVFGWCNEWYKRGMQETPDELIELFAQTKKIRFL